MRAGLRDGLRDHGYIDGSNIAIESRFADGKFDQLPILAQDLVRIPVAVLVTAFTPTTLAAKEATTSIPIVMVGVSDPVSVGIVTNLARPDGNITGTSSMTMDMAGKLLQLLREVVPGMRRVAVLSNPANRVYQTQFLQRTLAAAQSSAIQLRAFEAHDLNSIEQAFEAIVKDHPSGLIVIADPVLLSHAQRIAELANRAGIASVSGASDFAEAGGLISYGPSRYELARIGGRYVARILKGAKPVDLPIEQPTKFELVVNTTTAKRLGMSKRQSLQDRADRLVQ